MKSACHVLVLLIIIVYLECPESAAPKAGPFDIIWKTAGQCPNVILKKNSIQYEIKVHTHSRYYRTAHMNMTNTVTIDDTLKPAVSLSVMTNQGWKDNFFNLELGPFCASMKTYVPTTFKQIMRLIKMKDCPVPPGNYPNIVMDMNVTVLMDSLFYNDYKGRATLKKNGGLVFCVEALFSVVPKKRGPRKN